MAFSSMSCSATSLVGAVPGDAHETEVDASRIGRGIVAARRRRRDGEDDVGEDDVGGGGGGGENDTRRRVCAACRGTGGRWSRPPRAASRAEAASLPPQLINSIANNADIAFLASPSVPMRSGGGVAESGGGRRAEVRGWWIGVCGQ